MNARNLAVSVVLLSGLVMPAASGPVLAAGAPPPGVAPAASAVYDVEDGISIGGYGEMLYQAYADEDESGNDAGAANQLDALRAVYYIGCKFDDRFLFNSEIEFEHGSTENGGSVSLEFGYLEYRAGESARIRAGLLLLPLGFVNEMHEPPTFLGARRPETERSIIPTTWRETGVGVAGVVERVSYRAVLVNGFDGVGGGPSNAGGFDGDGLREGRQSGSEALAEDLALAARADLDLAPGVFAGAGLYTGGSGQGNTTAGEDIGGRVTILETHAELRRAGWQVRGLFAHATVDDAALLNDARSLTGTASIGSDLRGWYLEAGYDLFHAARRPQDLVAFARLERLDTQHEVPAGFARDGANERSVATIGVVWRPIDAVPIKTDVQLHRNEAETGVSQFNLATGYIF